MRTVILAGGEGTRLRPLTCDLPKPLARLCGKAILETLFDGLLRAGINAATLTLGYLPQMIEEAYAQGYGALALDFVREPEPLGTAGSVKNAVTTPDTVLVLSGDALCDYDFALLLREHEKSGAAVTIVAARVDDPREYGLLRTDDAGEVLGFVEKPGWSQAVGGLANTGIYVLSPAALAGIPAGQKVDFAQDLFPALLRAGEKIHCHVAEGYWCDVGDINTFLRASRDILDGRARVELGLRESAPTGDYTIRPPVYFGKNVHIARGAVVGPYAVLEDGVMVGADAKIRRSILQARARVEGGVRVTGALLCHDSLVRRGGSLFEGSVLGANAVAGTDSAVQPGVRVWPTKVVADGVAARTNVRYGVASRTLFGERGIEAGGRLTPAFCAALGGAMAAVPEMHLCAIGHDGSPRARALCRALVGGLQFGGASVWDYGTTFPVQLRFCGTFCGRGAAVFVGQDFLDISGEGGLPLPRGVERALETALANGTQTPAAPEQTHDAANVSNLRSVYRQELRGQCAAHSLELAVKVEGSNPTAREILHETLAQLGCREDEKLLLRLNATGERLAAWTKETGNVPHEKLLALCCLEEFKRGRPLALPSDAPQFLEGMARRQGVTLMRYLRSPTDDSDAAARRVAGGLHWTRDGLFLAVRLLSLVHLRHATLADLLAELPAIHVQQSYVDVSPTRIAVLENARELENLDAPEGYLLRRGLSKLLIFPGKSGRRLRLLAEAESMEAAQEITAQVEALLRQ
ncbi:MAG: NTP transferase domain-containing protein [Oscillospiraceae bacterium]|nr:NTP transferase domain-containing protein [Oscillospiraceae bacterium]